MAVTIEYACGIPGLTIAGTAFLDSAGDAAGVALTFVEDTTRTGYYRVTSSGLTAGLNWLKITGDVLDSMFVNIPASGTIKLQPSAFDAQSTPQTGDSYLIVNDGTNGNAAIKTSVGTAVTQTTASAIRTDIGLASANLDTQIATLATPTNITAGTITTVTNLTNAPTVGDFTATMKSSITSAVPTAATIAAAVWDYLTASAVAVGSFGKKMKDWVVGSLADGAITGAKFDASTAFPLTSVDTGSTRVARTGADSDTLETLSDQIDPILAAISALETYQVKTIVDTVTTAGTTARVKCQLMTYSGKLVRLQDVDPDATCTVQVIRDGSVPQFTMAVEDMILTDDGWFEGEFENPNFETDVGYTVLTTITADSVPYEDRVDNFNVWP